MGIRRVPPEDAASSLQVSEGGVEEREKTGGVPASLAWGAPARAVPV